MAGRNKYMSRFHKVRPDVLKRDHYKCVKCGRSGYLEVHHVNGYHDNDIENLQTLCRFCHGIAPMGKKYWEWLDNGKCGVENNCDFVIDELLKQYSKDELSELSLKCLNDIEKYNKESKCK